MFHAATSLQASEFQSVDNSTAAANPSQMGPRADYMTPGYSRSASVVSSMVGRQDEDISSIMMRGATDLRNAKYAIEEQRREIAFLQSQLDNVKGEKEEALKRLQSVKDAAKQSLEKSSKSLSNLEDVMNELKIRSQSSFEVVAKAQSTLPDIQEMRETVSEAMRSIEPFLDEDGIPVKSSETRQLVDTLQLECQKSQEVTDMLRDKLSCVGAELVDARNRVTGLENAQVMDRAALQESSRSEQLTDLAEAMKKQQQELYDILSIAAEADAKLCASNERISELTVVLEAKDSELGELRMVKHHNDSLVHQISEMEAKIESLERIAEEVDGIRKLISEKDLCINTLEVSLKSRGELAEELRSRLVDLESRMANDNEKIRELTGELREYKARETAAVKEAECRNLELQQTLQRSATVEEALDAVKKESDLRNEKLHDANTRCQILEERFEEQSITLTVTREHNGDLQERLITSEATHARAFESATGDLKCEIALLKEQNAQLQNIASQLDLKIKGQEGELSVMAKDYEERLKKQEELHRSREDAEEKRASRAEYDLAASRVMVQSLQEKLDLTTTEAQSIRERLNEALLPDPTLTMEVTALKLHIQNLEAERHKHLERAKTIDIRYKRGDLNEEEQTFINTLVQTSQAIHEQELIAKGNDLRRRDNTIKELRAKVHLLESSVAKLLKAQAQAKMAPPATENRSMINPAAWTSSDPSSSPPNSGSQAPDRDIPKESTNVDNPVTAKSTPAPSRVPIRPILAVSTGPLQVTPVQVKDINEQGKSATKAPKTPAANRIPALDPIGHSAPAKPAFGRLAMASSDEIAEFDVPLATVLRKRDTIESPRRSAESVTVSKPPLKRLRTSARIADERASGASTNKLPIPTSTSKAKSRKRR
ncbi:uncharacterized protein B0H18DRAFT_1112374 [Fomitopsis serialis]|uniref:uncharacterized protein n=1 Tax=Fomitopsis serialis TaxID=139415 RepID=UPI0020089D51|nr:uncharacterized protein B0H18DRAFT_1112374 [Neoantrodia serialis]KAH9938195.1 hypothetical protein B0H18DRAFT_1112374 [Neoantrodia serialis]